MTDADKIKFLQDWIERLSVDLNTYRGAAEYRQKRIDDLSIYDQQRTERIKQLETELAAAKAQAGKIVEVPGPCVIENVSKGFMDNRPQELRP